MRKSDARRIVQSGITWGRLQETLERAKAAGAADDRPSVVNRTQTKAIVYAILASCDEYEPDRAVVDYHRGECLAAQNILREFGKFWE